jgi:KUP system potassium uptake protein
MKRMASATGDDTAPAVSTETTSPTQRLPPRGRYLALLSLGALGVVYGDIGTSPLYAIRECFYGEHAVAVSRGNVLGVLSLIFWSLTLVISIKYLAFILRADNRGEGGILALMALVHPEHSPANVRRRHGVLIALGLFGAALLYGDGMITPAISVLSAVEGLEVATPLFRPYVIPLTVVILIGLFLFQRRGTAGVGAVFGPVTLVWFATLAALGGNAIARHPEVLAAVNPGHGVAFFAANGLRGYLVLGAVFLVVTGGEALYADMGHFGTRPIRLTWFGLVLPALLINYFGQGALLLADPTAAQNPFYHLAPAWGTYPLVVLSTAATVIASQAVISGSFSLSMQAIQLGYLPRLSIRHTSAEERGQIYMPQVNWLLMLATIGLVLGFRSSSNLAAAYGVAVTTTMVITTLIFYRVARELWGWPRWAIGALCLTFLVVDLAFFGASMSKIGHGGWFPLVVASAIFVVMTTWRRGRQILGDRLREGALETRTFLADTKLGQLPRVPGIGVFLTGRAEGVPPALLHNIKHNKVLHQKVVLLTVLTEEVPRVEAGNRLEVEDLGQGFFRVGGRYGFMEEPDVPRLLKAAAVHGLEVDPAHTSYFLGRERLLATSRPGMALWREHLFAILSRNAMGATAYFHLPTNRVVELGAQIEL